MKKILSVAICMIFTTICFGIYGQQNTESMEAYTPAIPVYQELKELGFDTIEKQAEIFKKMGFDDEMGDTIIRHGVRFYRFDLSVNGDNWVVLLLPKPGTYECHLLFFKKKQQEYGLIDYYMYKEHYLGKGDEVFSVVDAFDRKLGVIIDGSDGGTGIENKRKVVVLFNKDSVKKILELPYGGFRLGWGLFYDVTFNSSLAIETKDGVERLVVRYVIDYYSNEESGTNIKLFTKEIILRYKWDYFGGRLTIDKKNSTKAGDIRREICVDSCDNATFFEKHYSQIMDIASAKDRNKIKWLKSFLKQLNKERKKPNSNLMKQIDEINKRLTTESSS